VGDVFLRHIGDDGLRERTCSQFLDRLQMDRALLPSCPAGSVDAGACSGM
jgi:hypothetical protein